MYIRRERSGISFDLAREVIAGYAGDPARLEEMQGRITVLRLSCCFERLKSSGRFKEVFIDAPFDPDGQVWVRLNEREWRSLNADSTRPGGSAGSPEKRGWPSMSFIYASSAPALPWPDNYAGRPGPRTRTHALDMRA